jgi:hypothetical protein
MPATAWLKVINNQLHDTAAKVNEAQPAQTAVFVLLYAINDRTQLPHFYHHHVCISS